MYEPVPFILHDPEVALIDIADSSTLFAPYVIHVGADNNVGPVPDVGQPGILDVFIPAI